VAPSYRSANVIWAGSDDGLIHVTMNGGRTWKNVTPAGLPPWSKISLIEASHYDTLVAYAAVNSFRLDDLRPHIYRTRDGGRSWSHIAGGIPDGGIINAVREDPRKPGLLFAGSEREVYVSFDDGDQWQSLRLNMPAISIRDIVIKDDDLLAGTHGRGFWILDDITPLRQISPATASMPALLFQPARATRVRWNMNTDTPLPPDEPVAPNPPDGAIFTYWLRDAAPGAVTLEVHDRAGALVRKFSSDDPPERPIEGRNIPDYWIRPPQVLSASAGSHRFVWDLRYPDPKGVNFSYPIAAVYRNTAKDPAGPWVLPGTYTVTLTVAGARHSRPLSVRMDPRVKVSPLILAQQHALSLALTDAMASNADALQAVRALRARVRAAQTGASPTVQSALAAFDRQAAAVEGAGGAAPTLAGIAGQLAALYNTLQDADARPTSQLLLAIEDRRRGANAAWAAWRSLRDAQLAALNAHLAAAGAAPVP
jgi:CheY-like chemotaxis protein